MTQSQRYDCQECGQNVTAQERHTYDHCLAQFIHMEALRKPGAERRRKLLEVRERLLRWADQPNPLEVSGGR